MGMIDGNCWLEEFFTSEQLNFFPLTSHRMMLDDRVRMRAYAAAIKESVAPGDIVADLGTGTGVLAFLSAKHGARKVVGFDASELIETARQVKDRCFPNLDISFRKIDLLTGRLPRLRADMMVFEMLGSFGIDENTIAIVQRARSRLLKPGGRILPQRLRINVCPVEDASLAEWLNRWRKRIYGIDLSPYLRVAYNNAYLVYGHKMKRLGAPQCIARFDFRRARDGDRRATARFRISAPGELHGFVSWFEADLVPGRVLSSDPWRRPTHWGNVLFPIGSGVRVARGDKVTFSLSMRNAAIHEWRWRGSITAHASGRRSRTFDLFAKGNA